MNKSLEFISVIEACGLVDLGFTGQSFTWCNQRSPNARFWKRLDRVMVNDRWLEIMPQTIITHLSSVGSDHCPLLMDMVARQEKAIRYFKFLHFWVENQNFRSVVQNCWSRNIQGNPMWVFDMKMKRLATTLSTWSKTEYGDIFANVKDFEEQLKIDEVDIINNNTEENRSKLHVTSASYIKFLKLEESILKQKTKLQWFKYGDTNSKYFHVVMRGRKRKLFIHQNCKDNGDWIQGDDNIANAACEYFEGMFSGTHQRINEEVLNCIPRMLNHEQNQSLQEMPTEDEHNQVVFSMNPNSTAGPDGMSGNFYQSCWGVIKVDLLKVVQYFFCGNAIPKYFSHSCLVLLPKVDHPNKLTDFRPISLSNFISKIFSTLLTLRLAPILPSLISENQSSFVKGRSISKNIMLAQEIIHEIKKAKEGDNVVIKLDMAKAYDRVSWSFTCMVLRRMGFGKIFIDMVWRIMSNNRYGFFHSTRGLKQGDPYHQLCL